MATSRNTRRQGSVWSREEVRTLRKVFGNSPNTKVATLLQRSPKAVERKASKLGLQKTQKYLRTLGR